MRDVAQRANAMCATHLLHDAGLALREGDVTTRLVLDELDFDLPPLATGLVVVVVLLLHLVVGARSLDTAAGIASSVAIARDLVVVAGRRVLVVLGDLGGHDVWERGRKRYCVVNLTLWGRKGWGAVPVGALGGAGDLGGLGAWARAAGGAGNRRSACRLHG